MKTKHYIATIVLLLTLLNFNALLADTSSDPTPAPLPNDSLSFCRKQKWAKACLNVLLTYRCNQYYYPISPIRNKLCSAAAYSMIDYLDYKTVQVIENNKSYRFKVIFTNKLKSLISNPKVQRYLNSLALDLRQAMDLHKPFDLFQYTLQFAGDRDNAILWLGILFQDTTFSRVQVKYLEDLAQNGNLSLKELKAKEMMKEIAIMLEPKNLINENFQAWLKLYPTIAGNDLNSYLNPSFYHFYPIAVMASNLKQSRWLKNYAALIPFILNSDYEFQTLDPDNWPWRHPRPFKITPNLEWKMLDIYTGLIASLYGANQEAIAPTLNLFKNGFAANPFRTMQEWAYKN
jgi:hypothetical protein